MYIGARHTFLEFLGSLLNVKAFGSSSIIYLIILLLV